MEKYNISDNNSLKNEIKKILDLCEKKEGNEELRKTFFNAPISEDKIQEWEEKSGVAIPESYKDWLRFTEKCKIDGPTATFWGPDDFNSNYVPDDLIVIGEIIGDGEQVCFSKNNGELVTYHEGKVQNNCKNFSDILFLVLNMLSDCLIRDEEDFTMRMKDKFISLLSQIKSSDPDEETKKRFQVAKEYLELTKKDLLNQLNGSDQDEEIKRQIQVIEETLELENKNS